MGELGIFVTCHLVGPAEELGPLVLRDAEKPGDHLQWQLARHLLDEITGAVRRGGLDDVLGALGQFVTKPFDRARSETPGDDPAQPIMPLAVHIEQDDTLHLDVFARHVIGELRQRGVRPGVIDVVAPRNFLDVLVLGDDPVTAIVEAALADSLFAPPDRRGRAQFGQLVDR